ncbi:hypothetical protein MNBD_GAMMA13-778 [hydrothermal vent metagenome]|uniref:Inner membrane protein YjeT (Clustered with HflC) n=1 Tax=hydrothermal vent metagenome TaxID=652676 RepID=A0A3B0YFF7_9ZZZZ
MWTDLWAALALLLVLEGILPFLNPEAVRRMLQAVSQVDDRGMRISGLVSMLVGLALLYVIR